MKKILLTLSLTLCVLGFLATAAFAADDVYYDLGGGERLYVNAEVCKIADCATTGSPSDWYNYSTTSENMPGDSGSAQTLVAKPGDTLTFRDTALVYTESYMNPVFGMSFTNDQYLTFGDAFENGLEDIDTNGNEFVYNSADNIYLIDNPRFENPEVGAMLATIKADTPDGTIITGTFYVVNPNNDERNIGLGAGRAMAAEGDDYVRSTVRILVSNPAPVITTTTLAQPAQTATPLPTTGADKASQLPYIFLLISFAISYGTFKLLTSAKRKYLR